jgi:hypothetical protein
LSIDFPDTDAPRILADLLLLDLPLNSDEFDREDLEDVFDEDDLLF